MTQPTAKHLWYDDPLVKALGTRTAHAPGQARSAPFRARRRSVAAGGSSRTSPVRGTARGASVPALGAATLDGSSSESDQTGIEALAHGRQQPRTWARRTSLSELLSPLATDTVQSPAMRRASLGALPSMAQADDVSACDSFRRLGTMGALSLESEALAAAQREAAPLSWSGALTDRPMGAPAFHASSLAWAGGGGDWREQLRTEREREWELLYEPSPMAPRAEAWPPASMPSPASGTSHGPASWPGHREVPAPAERPRPAPQDPGGALTPTRLLGSQHAGPLRPPLPPPSRDSPRRMSARVLAPSPAASEAAASGEATQLAPGQHRQPKAPLARGGHAREDSVPAGPFEPLRGLPPPQQGSECPAWAGGAQPPPARRAADAAAAPQSGPPRHVAEAASPEAAPLEAALWNARAARDALRGGAPLRAVQRALRESLGGLYALRAEDAAEPFGAQRSGASHNLGSSHKLALQVSPRAPRPAPRAPRPAPRAPRPAPRAPRPAPRAPRPALWGPRCGARRRLTRPRRERAAGTHAPGAERAVGGGGAVARAAGGAGAGRRGGGAAGGGAGAAAGGGGRAAPARRAAAASGAAPAPPLAA